MELTRFEGNQLDFLFAGDAVFTLESAKTGTRFTYKVSRAKDRATGQPTSEELFWVGLLSGPDNTHDYTFMGRLLDRKYLHSPKRMSAAAPAVRAFVYWYDNLQAGQPMPDLNFYHCGFCCRCGRLLTTPESVKAGIGPVCAGLQ